MTRELLVEENRRLIAVQKSLLKASREPHGAEVDELRSVALVGVMANGSDYTMWHGDTPAVALIGSLRCLEHEIVDRFVKTT